ncbi:MAG TPA: ABC transporter ATP-binding protein [Conexivisphaerales archaeon]|nr:ABC transporter ATP-binding protein [Conexivisphaerales archaeon]
MVRELLEVENLTVEYKAPGVSIRAVNDVSFRLAKGDTLGLVGESGSGKSTLGHAIMRLVDPPGTITGGRIYFADVDLLSLSSEEMRKVRGKRIAMVFQDPMSSLSPVKNVGDHFVEYIREHDPNISKDSALAIAKRIFEDLGMDKSRVTDYPHQFSGGMRQRVMIGLALALDPLLIVADEPTTALDVVVEAQILELLKALKKSYSASMLLITHNMGVVAETADRIAVMYAGKLMEVSDTARLYSRPMNPYTEALLGSIPNILLNDQVLKSIPGMPPDMAALPKGCPFSPRCPYVFDRCRVEDPPLKPVGDGTETACHLHG